MPCKNGQKGHFSRLVRLSAVSFAVELCTCGRVEPFALEATELLLSLLIIFKKYAEGLTAAPRLLMRS